MGTVPTTKVYQPSTFTLSSKPMKGGSFLSAFYSILVVEFLRTSLDVKVGCIHRIIKHEIIFEDKS